jgi:crotonobetainyl-CoA:carnitine CoA-transferase CaiB-like acyl-CoA transferase
LSDVSCTRVKSARARALGRCTIVFAAAGEASMLPGGIGYRLNPDGPPLVARGHLVDSDTGVIVAMCAAAALRRGEPASVDVAKQECEASLNRWLVTHYVASGWIESRATRAYAFAGLMECRDGFVMLQPTTDGHWAGLKAMLGDPEWAQAPEFATQDLRLQAGKAIQRQLAEWARHRTKAEIFELALANNVPGAPFRTMPDVAACPQFAARGFLVGYGPDGRLPGLPFAAHPAANVAGDSAPDLGQHNADVLAQVADLPTAAGAS